jgi:hypothetical protein
MVPVKSVCGLLGEFVEDLRQVRRKLSPDNGPIASIDAEKQESLCFPGV